MKSSTTIVSFGLTDLVFLQLFRARLGLLQNESLQFVDLDVLPVAIPPT